MTSLHTIDSLSRKSAYGPVFVALAIIVALFFAHPQYQKYFDLGATSTNLETQKQKFTQELSDLQNIKDEYSASSGSSLVSKIAQPFENSEVLDAVMINSFTKKNLDFAPDITITNISIDEGKKLPNGLYQASVNLGLTAGSIDTIVDYLSYLSSSTKYAFTLDTINLPIDTEVGITSGDTDISMNVTLGVYSFR
ncbi:hypothetical protein CSB09_00075 [Candidatus Gracilibacteria bacterium]|nr:MAG: hypothetical protein CSB09_00075 [Candidatus Gracilibacteria bacterium]